MLKIGGDDNVCVPHDAYARVDILNRHRQTNYYSLSHCARGTIEHIDCTHILTHRRSRRQIQTDKNRFYHAPSAIII